MCQEPGYGSDYCLVPKALTSQKTPKIRSSVLKEIFTIPITNKRLISEIYKEFFQGNKIESLVENLHNT
jgi:hypothetical protein